MTPSAEQIRQAIRNHQKPPRTLGARVMAALRHIQESEIEKPGAMTSSDRAGVLSDANRQTQHST